MYVFFLNGNGVRDIILFKCKTRITMICLLRDFNCYVFEHKILLLAFIKTVFSRTVNNWIYCVSFLFNPRILTDA